MSTPLLRGWGVQSSSPPLPTQLPHAWRLSTGGHSPSPQHGRDQGPSAASERIAQDQGRNQIWFSHGHEVIQQLLVVLSPILSRVTPWKEHFINGIPESSSDKCWDQSKPKRKSIQLLLNLTATYEVSLCLKLPAVISVPHTLLFITWDCPSIKQQLAQAGSHQRWEAAIHTSFSVPLARSKIQTLTVQWTSLTQGARGTTSYKRAEQAPTRGQNKHGPCTSESLAASAVQPVRPSCPIPSLDGSAVELTQALRPPTPPGICTAHPCCFIPGHREPKILLGLETSFLAHPLSL